MTIERWDPFREMMTLRDAMNRLFEESFVRPSVLAGVTRGLGTMLDLYETENEYHVEMPLPGVRPEDVEITAEQNTLTIRGEIKPPPEEEERKRTYLLRECRYGTFQRTITLPMPINADQIEATFEHGVLKMTIPKAPEARPRRIPVTAGRAAGQLQIQAGQRT